jgi:hypothetical protein
MTLRRVRAEQQLRETSHKAGEVGKWQEIAETLEDQGPRKERVSPEEVRTVEVEPP